jgi:hypothetical protein
MVLEEAEDSPLNTLVPADSADPTETLAPVPLDGALPDVLPTDVATAVAVLPTVPPPIPPTAALASGRLPLELWIGGSILLSVFVYGGLYFAGAVAVDRYKAGFVVKTCPVCERGNLHVETRVDRLLGIPRVRRTVRCDACRSVLREVGLRRWRYAIDRLENPTLYRRFNNKLIDEVQLSRLNSIEQIEAPQVSDDGDAKT